MPLMSDNNERSFNAGRDIITYRYTRLKSDIIEAYQCLKSWCGVDDEIFDNEEAIEKDMDADDKEI